MWSHWGYCIYGVFTKRNLPLWVCKCAVQMHVNPNFISVGKIQLNNVIWSPEGKR